MSPAEIFGLERRDGDDARLKVVERGAQPHEIGGAGEDREVRIAAKLGRAV